jgi:hypothetical protein
MCAEAESMCLPSRRRQGQEQNNAATSSQRFAEANSKISKMEADLFDTLMEGNLQFHARYVRFANTHQALVQTSVPGRKRLIFFRFVFLFLVGVLNVQYVTSICSTNARRSVRFQSGSG